MHPAAHSFLTRALCAVCLFLITSCRSNPEPHASDNEHWAVIAATQEAHRRGWKNIEVIDYRFNGSVWTVRLARKPHQIPGSLALVQISPEGDITNFLINSR